MPPFELLAPLAGLPGALLAAALWDALCGEWPSAAHPVVWMGRVCRACERVAPSSGPLRQWLWGLAVALGVPAVFAGSALGLLAALASWPWALWLAEVWLLKAVFSVRGLGRESLALCAALDAADLRTARKRLRGLCSRDAEALDRGALVSATVESLAENASDSIVAPLFYLALFGVPGALFYRTVNTLDARIGYRGRYEYLGKASARLDDLLNLVPARLTAMLLLGAALLTGDNFRQPWRVMRRDAGSTASPNAGWPMAAMAAALQVRLEKPGHHVLGDGPAHPQAEAIGRAWRLVKATAVCAVAASLLALWGRHGTV